MPDVERWSERTPVFVNDIISTARTMIATAGHLLHAGMKPTVGVHAVFAGRAYEELVGSGIARVVTCSTIRHVSNDIDVSNTLTTAVGDVRIDARAGPHRCT